MKKISLLNTISIVPIAFASTIPLFSINSCATDPILNKLEADTVSEFKKFVHIPRPSDLFLYKKPNTSNCLQISNYLKQRVKELTGIEPNQDIYANLWFDVPCNDEQYADSPTIALQCHMDMVFAYDPKKFPLPPDPMQTIIEVDDEIKDGKRVIHSKDYKTSIGADNGIGIAGILALISNKDVKHGNLRVIFTNCEENAMQGSMMLVDGHRNDAGEVVEKATAPNIMNGVKYVVNLDTGINKSVCVSGSGAVGSHYNKTFVSTTQTLPYRCKISVSGFLGGHSAGAPRQNCGNAIKAANEILDQLDKVELISYTTPGTTAYNNVPSACEVEFATNSTVDAVIDAKKKVINDHKDETDEYYWKDIEDAKFDINHTQQGGATVLSQEDSQKIINLHKNLWYGFDKEAYSKDHTKTSANVGPTTLEYTNGSGTFSFSSSSYSRSDDEEQIKKFKKNNLEVAGTNFEYLCDAQFHPWVRDANTKLLTLTKAAIADALNCKPEEVVESEAHGGLECTWWAYAMKNIEKIEDGASTCLGINVNNEHKFTETVDVGSIKNCMKAVIYIFKHFNQL